MHLKNIVKYMASTLTGMHCKLAGTNRRKSKEQRGPAGEGKRRTSSQTHWTQNAALML